MFALHDEVVGIGNLGGLCYLLVRSTLHTERDIVTERVVEKNSLLIDIADELSQVVNA